jgi:hypothetical protein
MKLKSLKQTSLAFGLGITLGIVTLISLSARSGDSTTQRSGAMLHQLITNAQVKLLTLTAPQHTVQCHYSNHM